MNEPSAALAASLPPALGNVDLWALLWILVALGLSAFCATLRAALQFSLPARVLAAARGEAERARIAPLLERVEALAISAGIYKITADLVFVALLIRLTAVDGQLDWMHLALAVGIAAPALLLVTEALPASIAAARGDALLLRTLPAFRLLQLPVAWIGVGLQALRRSALRTLGIRDDAAAPRKLVEGLREVVRGSAPDDELEETERELIENVMEFGDVDAAEVMTPRTELCAVPADTHFDEAIRVMAEAGHSRIPVYGESIDNIIGTVTALALAKARAEEPAPSSIADLLRPPLLVPETKLVSELLKEFRTSKQKMAIVLDEYGGTAGIVTLTDVLAEIVGDIQDEFEEHSEPIRRLEGGAAEVQASLHVSEVNEALGLAIPEEEDFETLGGFVLAELGHFPKEGETFSNGEATFRVVEASDRRVFKVLVQRSA